MVVHCIRCILPIVCIGYKIKKYILYLSLKIDFISANRADTDEMPLLMVVYISYLIFLLKYANTLLTAGLQKQGYLLYLVSGSKKRE